MPRHGKKYRKASENPAAAALNTVENAVKESLAASFVKFDETVDVAICLGVDPKHSDQMVRGATALPHGLGKTVRVAAFCKGEKEGEAKEAGADFAGAEELVEKIKGGWMDGRMITPAEFKRLASLESREVLLAKLAGAPTSPTAGLETSLRVGDAVERGQPLLTLHAESPGELAYALEHAATLQPFVLGEVP